MAKLSEEAKKAISEIHPALVATANKNGRPNVSAKGSFRVLDDEHVLFCDIRSPRTVANLRDNSQVSAIVLDVATRKGCRVWGKAEEILTSGALFEKLSSEFAARKMKVNHVVTITVNEFEVF